MRARRWKTAAAMAAAAGLGAAANSPTNTAAVNPARLLGNALADAIERAMPSVVTIRVARHVKRATVNPATGELEDQEGVMLGSGSGFFITAEGHILTAHHVVDGRKVQIGVMTHDGRTYEAKVVGTDPNTDLAVLKIQPPANGTYRPLEPGDSDRLRIGEFVVALGAPLGLERTATLGIVSQKGRNIGKLTFESMIQTDASINPGSSGGPVVDVDGRWIGVSVMIETTGDDGGNVGIGFVMPSSLARRVSEILVRHGQMVRSYIGIAPEQMTPDSTPLPAGLKEAVRIARVLDGSPAAVAGLKVGDIVLKIDGHPTPTLQEIKKYMHTHEPGNKVRFEILRDGQQMTVEVIASRPPQH